MSSLPVVVNNAPPTCLPLALHAAAKGQRGERACVRRRPSHHHHLLLLHHPLPFFFNPSSPQYSPRSMATTSFRDAAYLALLCFSSMLVAISPALVPDVDPTIRLPSDRPIPDTTEEDETGTTWALLVAGSSGYGNYRHQVRATRDRVISTNTWSAVEGRLKTSVWFVEIQADVCHAYQLLRKGGLKEENIVVMMRDDIADNPLNPRKGVIINHPQGQDVYAGVPKVEGVLAFLFALICLVCSFSRR